MLNENEAYLVHQLHLRPVPPGAALSGVCGNSASPDVVMTENNVIVASR